MKYQIVAEAYRDLEQASGRLAMIDRLAALLAAAGLLQVTVGLGDDLVFHATPSACD